ncbi:MAG: DUF2238 domain-containing protein [Myxococcota bacterium]
MPRTRAPQPERDPHVGHRWAENPLLRVLVGAYAAIWIWAAWSPRSRDDWALENLLVVALVATLVVGYRRLVFSNLTHVLLFVFLVLHAVGSHYTYTFTPVGFWVQDAFDLSRNPYDRIVHFAFGLLMTYPLRELVLRVLHVHGFWSYGLPAASILSLSATYEILEALAARIFDPELGIAFVGAQGDEWDAQWDMGLALLGAAISLVSTALYRAWRGREPWSLGAPH